MILVFFNFFLWSSVFSFGKTALEHSPPLFLTGTRMLLAGVLMLGFLLFFKRDALKVKKGQLLHLALLALTAVYLTNAFEFWGLQYLTAAKTCFIYSLTPFVAAIFSYFQFKEKLTPKKLLGMGIGFLGFIPVFLHQGGGEESLGGFFIFSWAELALIAATITSVYGWVVLRKLGKEGMNPVMSNGSAMVLGGLFALVHSYFGEGWSPFPVVDSAGFMKPVLMIILVSNLICYNLYGWLLKRFTATFMGFAGLVTPLFAAFFGFILHGETVPWVFFPSVGILCVGLWLVYSEELRLGYIVKKGKEPAAETTS
ncbi:MAG: S-adenosylmethionine/S-adenosylhomocysteine transporter [Chlamydiales bacterium]|nr:S-adenosylmethionine/S-adenosylhomocysteine transporter [Chlamydiales bacterium]